MNQSESRARMLRRRRVTVLTAAAVAVAVTAALIVMAVRGGSGDSLPTQTTEPHPTESAQIESPPEQPPEPAAYDVSSPDSITVVVNKQRPMQPIAWQPTDLVVPEGVPNNWGDSLRIPAAEALVQMYAAADADGVPFIVTSGFRDYDRQAALFNGYVASDGLAAADTYSARPGHSEHQTGLVADLTDGGECTLEACFGETATGLWLRENSWRFGYILRYDDGEEAVVGYTYEPWHFRYVGVEVSTAMHEQSVANLEDFLGLPAAPSY